jgi:hypothetical protein
VGEEGIGRQLIGSWYFTGSVHVFLFTAKKHLFILREDLFSRQSLVGRIDRPHCPLHEDFQESIKDWDA